MTSVENPPAKKSQKACRYYSAPFPHLRSIRNKCFSKMPQSRKVQEGSRKETRKLKMDTGTLFRNTAIQ